MNDMPPANDPPREDLDLDEGDHYVATVFDTIGHRQIGEFGFFAKTPEDARERGWRIAGRFYTPDIMVRIRRASK